MKLAILCLSLASAACAAPFQYLPHYTGARQQVPPPLQVNNHFAGGFPHAGLPGGYSVELIYPHRFPGVAGGSNPAQPFSSFGLIKYSIPQPPGRQSVEVFYAYDFAQQRIIPNIPPMTNGPIVPEVLPFDYPTQNIPQQNMNIPSYGANALPSQDPPKLHPQDQPIQTSQMPAKA